MSHADRDHDPNPSGRNGALLTRLAALEQRVAHLERTISGLNTVTKLLPVGDERGGDVKPEHHAIPDHDFKKGSVAAAVPGFDITIVFDGGSVRNPGKGYGSYLIITSGGQLAGQRLDFGDNVTNNQAEYRTLVVALRDATTRDDVRPEEASVAVRGDSSLVINQLAGRWKVKHPDLQPLHREAALLLQRFKRIDVGWQPRSLSVRVLGH